MQIRPEIRKRIDLEAQSNQRSLNEEAVILLKEALAHRTIGRHAKRDEIHAILDRYATAAKRDHRSVPEVIEYDETGLPT